MGSEPPPVQRGNREIEGAILPSLRRTAPFGVLLVEQRSAGIRAHELSKVSKDEVADEVSENGETTRFRGGCDLAMDGTLVGALCPLRFWPGLCASPTAPLSESAPEEVRAKVKGTN